MDNFFTRAASVIRNEHRPPRLYHLYNLILMFFIFSFTGWVWEVIYIGFTEGVVAKRGMLHGPWLPIYGVGGVLILLLLSRFRNNPPLVFLLAALLCGTIRVQHRRYNRDDLPMPLVGLLNKIHEPQRTHLP